VQTPFATLQNLLGHLKTPSWLIARTMMKALNDNSTWRPLGLHALRLQQRLEEQRSDGEREQTPNSEVKKQREHERFVETRLREIDRFERRFRKRT
jgi:hypothetical protein